MLHLFADPSAVQGDLLIIRGPEVNHIRNVLRMKKGERISVSDGAGREFVYALEEIGEEEVTARRESESGSSNELPAEVILFQGLPKSDKMDFIVQKCTELGVSGIVPVETARSVVKLDKDRAGRKTARWQKIAESAAMQSRRGKIPKVHEPVDFVSALRYAGEKCYVRLIPYELSEDDAGTSEILESIKPGDRIAVFIGPEGGFESSEIEAARKAGVQPVTLGRRILRTETAGIAVLSILTYILEIR